jgi:hypothetical protein
MSELTDWDSFYVIVGSAAGALIGLQFVVMTLIAQRPPRVAEEGTAAFSTPTVVHFGTVFFLSAILRAPWHAITPVAVLWGLLGVGGILYTGIVARRMRSQKAYKPEFEDWSFHAVLPFMGYVVLAITAIVAPSHIREALFGVGAAALLLVFCGIHNSWDAVAYFVLVHLRSGKD